MKKILLQTTALLLILEGMMISCGKEKDVQQNIVGIWVKETTYVDGTGDTIIFTNDYQVEKYFKDYENSYKYKLKDNTIVISVNSSDDFVVEGSFKYSINENKLTIFRFTYPFSLVAIEREDLIFRKIN